MASTGKNGGGCSRQVSALITSMREKGSRNKRKFWAQPPLGYVNRAVSSAHFEGSNYGFSAEEFEIASGQDEPSACSLFGVNDGHSDASQLHLGFSNPAAAFGVGLSHFPEELDGDEFQDAGWSDVAEEELHKLVSSNLDAIYKCAIKVIVSCGYSEDVATRALLKSGVFYGCKDPVSNVVDNALPYLSDQELHSPGSECFRNLQELGMYILAEVICVLKEVRPCLSTGDILWWLLLCDMNVSQFCPAVSESSGILMSDGALSGSSGISTQPQSKVIVKNTEIHVPTAHKTVAYNSYLHSAQSEVTTVANPSNITKPKNNPILHGQITEKVITHPTSGSVNKLISVTGTCQHQTMEEKIITSRKVHSGYSRRELLRQKSLHIEKGYQTYGYKGSSRIGKLGSLGGRSLDKKMRSVSDLSTVSLKAASIRISKAVGMDIAQDSAKEDLLVQAESVTAFKPDTYTTNSLLPKANVASFSSPAHSPPALPNECTSPVLPADDTELSLSLSVKSNSYIEKTSCNTDASTCSSDGIPSDKSLGQWIQQDKKDESILKLLHRVQELENQLQEWTEWANQKVMKAARRLGKEKAEVKLLRQDKEEIRCIKKDKQALEESTMKKLAEMENALQNASGQIDRANASVSRLEIENATLKKEMEAAKLHAAESAASCQEALEKEKKTLMEFRSWERQKCIFQEELTSERRHLAQSEQELEQARVLYKQIELRWKQEEKVKDEILMQVSSVKLVREQIEASTRTKEDMLKLKSEKNLQRCKDDIERHEKEILQLRLKTDSSRIAALKQGINGSYVTKLPDAKSAKAHKTFESIAAEFLEYSEMGGVKRERECVMCLSEEMSVIYLPCAHQVVCNACNELHEKQGMKDCPSCRSPIQRRISVRFART